MRCVLLLLLMGIANAQDLQPEQCGGKPVDSNDTPYHQNGRFTFLAVPSPNLVPYPTSLRASAQYLSLLNCSLSFDDASLSPLAELLSVEVLAITAGAVNLSVGAASSTPVDSAVISLSLSTSPHGAAGGYSLVSTAKGATLSATSYAGVVSATATLLQAIEFSGDYDAVPRTKLNCTTVPEWRLPALNIQDSPALPYRGIMVDAARAFLPLSSLQGFVTLCRLYKLNYLHIHLSDDGAFTFPSTTYPELANGSAWKYTLKELQDLQSFAKVRNVEIVGEVDVPGHARSMISSLPGVFAFPSKSVGVVDFTNASVISALQNIFDEIQAVFPSSYIHMCVCTCLEHCSRCVWETTVSRTDWRPSASFLLFSLGFLGSGRGGDEVNFGELNGLPEIASALKRENVNTTADLYSESVATYHQATEL